MVVSYYDLLPQNDTHFFPTFIESVFYFKKITVYQCLVEVTFLKQSTVAVGENGEDSNTVVEK